MTELIVNAKAWDTLPADLKEIVRSAAAACNVISQSWCEATNAEAFEDLVNNQGVKASPLPPEVLAKLKEVSKQVLADAAAKDPLVKKVSDSFFDFKSKVDKWAGVSVAVFHANVRGQI